MPRTNRHAIAGWCLALCLLANVRLSAQSNSGELHFSVSDSSGQGIKASIHILSAANHYDSVLETDEHGTLDVQQLPYGNYQVEIQTPGFAPMSEAIVVHSSLPKSYRFELKLPTYQQSVTVTAASTLIDTSQAGSVSHIGSELIERRLSATPGRSLQDLVNSQPGWLYEGNAVLHPRGAENQTQFVVDGVPLTENRSPSLGPELEADEVQSLSIYTAGIPAEYGRKLGGVIEVNTLTDPQPGLHGTVALSGGSFDTAGGFAKAQYAAGANSFAGSASGARSDRYLNPVVPQNFSNTGTVGDFSGRYQRSFGQADRLDLTIRHGLSRHDIPNEQVQQAAGQRQTADNLDTFGAASYQHVFSAEALADLRGMVRDNATDFESNPASTPILLFQHNRFREGYAKATVTASHGRQEWKFGVETDNVSLHEHLNYTITDPSQFDPGMARQFAFTGARLDLEQSAFVQDLIRAGYWTINAGLRWDHYQLLLNRQAVGPRLAVSRYFPSADLVLHFSYDRVFQTPTFQNILLSSSAEAASLESNGAVRLPVRPSEGDYYEAGFTKGLAGKLNLSVNYFRRFLKNAPDDDQIQNTTVSIPVAFRKAIVYGAEAKLDMPQWRRFSGFLSYSYTVGNAWFPVLGGLFLGANGGETQTTGHVPDSQDQRNIVRARVHYQATTRLWLATGLQYDSGLPFAFDGDPATVLAQYGQPVLDRINFDRGRIRPAFLLSASAGADLYRSDRVKTSLQLDGENLTDVLDVMDFAGMFSGNAIGPPRSFALRLTTRF